MDAHQHWADSIIFFIVAGISKAKPYMLQCSVSNRYPLTELVTSYQLVHSQHSLILLMTGKKTRIKLSTLKSVYLFPRSLTKQPHELWIFHTNNENRMDKGAIILAIRTKIIAKWNELWYCIIAIDDIVVFFLQFLHLGKLQMNLTQVGTNYKRFSNYIQRYILSCIDRESGYNCIRILVIYKYTRLINVDSTKNKMRKKTA